MTPKQVLAVPPRALSQAQRELYLREGYLLLESAIAPERIERLRAATTSASGRTRTTRTREGSA